jgi:aspartyl-tRNA synthetase
MWEKRVFSSQALKAPEGSRVKLYGWIHSIRDLGKVCFLILRDKEGFIQLVASPLTMKEEGFASVKRLRREFVVSVEGVVKRSEKAPGGAEVHAERLEVLNEAHVPPHLEPDRRLKLDLEVRLDERVLDLRRPENYAIFKVRHVVLSAARSYLEAQGFMEVHTPKLIATATEGGAALFPIAYFEREAFLAQSPQLYKEQLAAVFERVYEVGPLFRAEESQTNRHLAEYVGIDVEAAFADEEDAMEVLEGMVKRVVEEVVSKCRGELEVLGRELEVPSTPFPRLSYDEALKVLERRGIKMEWGQDFTTEAERALGEELRGPFFIVDWPSDLKPFYIKPRDDDPSRSYSFDLMYGWLEVASGGRRIHRAEELVDRMRRQGLNPEGFKHHLKCYEYGMPPHSGWGLGLARLMMVITGRQNIREVVLYPRDRWRLTP